MKAIKTWKVLNPRGRLAKDMEVGLRRSVWLVRLCELWLLYCDGDHRVASSTTPFTLPPHAWDDELSKRLAKAIKGTELWARPGEVPKSKFRLLKSGPKVYERPAMNPSYIRRAPWSVYYNQWWDGSLERGISDLMKCLPKSNRKRIKALLNET